jgi:predicted transcriptional regulator
VIRRLWALNEIASPIVPGGNDPGHPFGCVMARSSSFRPRRGRCRVPFSVPAVELPTLIGSVHDALTKAANGLAQQPAEEPKAPAVSIKKSVQPDYIVCLDDGKRFKSLKRHLRTTYNLTPDQYRTKWGLARDYPMVAPNYAAARSELAKQMGLGARRRKPESTAPAAAPTKGRRKKAA